MFEKHTTNNCFCISSSFILKFQFDMDKGLSTCGYLSVNSYIFESKNLSMLDAHFKAGPDKTGFTLYA